MPAPEIDLFVSYRRAANAAHDKWVDAFCDELRATLAELLGRNVLIWRDTEQLRASENWRQRLEAALENAAIFLAVFSRSYLLSDECRRELDRFLGVMKEGRQRRLMPVFKQPPDPKAPVPPEVSTLQRHEFFHWSPPGSPYWEELAPHGAPAEEREFYSALSRLAQDIMLALAEIEGARRRESLGTVFLARVSPELEPDRERLRADLVSARYLVVPANEYLWNADDLHRQIEADLAAADLCVHVVDAGASIEPEAANRARLQLVLAHQAMKAAGKPAPVVWLRHRERADPSTAELVETITGDLANQGVDYWGGGVEELKTLVYDKLPHADAAVPAAAAPEVALLVEEADIGADGALRALLVERLAVEPRPVKLLAGLPRDAARAQRTLAGCGHALVFWCGQPQEWLDDVLGSSALAAHLKAGTLAVVVAPPSTPEKAVYRSTRVVVVDARGDATESALRNFLQRGRR